MFSIAKKEFHQFFSSLTGYITIILFLLVCGLYLFVLKDSNLFDFGYATLNKTFEILQTRPLTRWQIVSGKYLAVLTVIIIALLPTLLYVYTIHSLSTAGIDGGGIAGSYIGLVFLAAVFGAISMWCSGLTSNAVIAFLTGAFACLIVYFGFNAVSKLPVFTGNADYYIEMLGIDFHYRSISRGVIDTRDVIYFLSVIFLFLFATQKNLSKK